MPVARKKTPKTRVNVKALISTRLREVRQDIFGEHGGPELARRLGLPARTWYNYETGVTVPAEVLLSFMDQTGINPMWLLNGSGPKYRSEMEDMVLAELSPEELIRRGLEKLEREPEEVQIVAPENLPAESRSDFVAVPLLSLDSIVLPVAPAEAMQGYILAYRHWLPHPRATIGVRLEDDAMHPILPAGSVVAIDKTVRDPQMLQARLVAANVDGKGLIRWLDLSGRHLILRPNQASRDFPMIPIELDDDTSPIIGQVVWSWSRFGLP